MLISPFKNRRYLPVLAVSLTVFLLFFFLFGVVMANDSWSFMEGNLRVSPLYPLLLRLFRTVFGENAYLTVTVVFQELLTAYAVFSLSVCIGERCSLKPLFTCLLPLVFAAAYALRLLVVGKEALYCNTIMTEGLTFPLYFLFIKYIFAAWNGKKLRFLTAAMILSFLLAVTRGQLINTFLVLLVLFPVCLKGRDNKCKQVLQGVGLSAAYFLCIFLVSCSFHLAFSGSFTPTTQGKESVLGNILYCSESADAALLPDGSDEQSILRSAMERAEDRGLTSRSAPGGLVGCFEHYEASHDDIRDIVQETIAQKYAEQDIDTVHIRMAEFSEKTVPVLLFHNFGKYLKNCLVNMTGGLVRSNSIMRRAGVLLSVFVYLVCAAFLIFFRENAFLRPHRILMGCILVSTAVNCVFCSFGVFELSRYVYYNFPLIYLSLLVGLAGILNIRKESKVG